MPRHPAFTSGLLALALAAPCLAGPADEALDPAIAQALERARAGDVETQRQLGRAYYRGGQVERDWAQSAHWFHEAAEQGDAESQRWLGLMYRDGVGVAADADAAFRWLERAAHQGDVEAQGALGSLFEEGVGVAADPSRAFAWYLSAAEAGHGGAQYNVGAMYLNGVGVEADPVAAVMWLTLAADREYSARYLLYSREEEIPTEALAEGRRRAVARGADLREVGADAEKSKLVPR